MKKGQELIIVARGMILFAIGVIVYALLWKEPELTIMSN